jgi:hypothetical protein
VNEADWQSATDPQPMLDYLSGRASERKLRLFAAAWCRRVWPLLTDARSRRAVEVAERFADGEASAEDLHLAAAGAEAVAEAAMTAVDTAHQVAQASAALAALHATRAAAEQAADYAASSAASAAYHAATPFRSPSVARARAAERAAQARLLAELFGSPFHRVSVEPAWLAWGDRLLPRLARAIYDEQAFDRLPYLADALEEAGCADAVVLAHCRRPGEHLRGCWALDLLLPDRRSSDRP